MLKKKFTKNSLQALAMLTSMTFASSSIAATTYSNDFEGLNAVDAGALGADGWLVGGVVSSAGNPGSGDIGSYFAYPAPNGGPAFSGVAVGEGGAAQGNQQLSVYNDYNNPEHGSGNNNTVEAFVFTDVGILGLDDVGTTINFSFDTKVGNLASPTTALAYMSVLKTSDSSFFTLGTTELDTTSLGAGGWNGGTLSLLIDSGMVGETLQIGFTSTATNFDASGVFYDNINVGAASVVPVPAAVWLFGSGLLGLVGVARRRNS